MGVFPALGFPGFDLENATRTGGLAFGGNHDRRFCGGLRGWNSKKDVEVEMTAATLRCRWTWMFIGSLLLCAFCFPTQALGNIWKSTFGQGWFYESRAWADQVLAGTWWEASLTPGNTYN